MTLDEFLEGANILRAAAAKRISAMTDAAAEQVRRKTLEMQLKKAYTDFGQLAYRQLTDEGVDQSELEKAIAEIARLEELLASGGGE